MALATAAGVGLDELDELVLAGADSAARFLELTANPATATGALGLAGVSPVDFALGESAERPLAVGDSEEAIDVAVFGAVEEPAFGAPDSPDRILGVSSSATEVAAPGFACDGEVERAEFFSPERAIAGAEDSAAAMDGAAFAAAAGAVLPPVLSAGFVIEGVGSAAAVFFAGGAVDVRLSLLADDTPGATLSVPVRKLIFGRSWPLASGAGMELSHSALASVLLPGVVAGVLCANERAPVTPHADARTTEKANLPMVGSKAFKAGVI